MKPISQSPYGKRSTNIIRANWSASAAYSFSKMVARNSTLCETSQIDHGKVEKRYEWKINYSWLFRQTLTFWNFLRWTPQLSVPVFSTRPIPVFRCARSIHTVIARIVTEATTIMTQLPTLSSMRATFYQPNSFIESIKSITHIACFKNKWFVY